MSTGIILFITQRYLTPASQLVYLHLQDDVMASHRWNPRAQDFAAAQNQVLLVGGWPTLPLWKNYTVNMNG